MFQLISMSSKRILSFTVSGMIAAAVLLMTTSVFAQVTTEPTPPAAQSGNAKMAAELHRQTVAKGIKFLLEQGQDREDGSYSKQLSPAVTSMCTSALLRNGVAVENPQIKKSLAFIESLIKPDGGIYAPESTLRNYETSVAIMCLSQANEAFGDSRYDETIAKAASFLKEIQWDRGEGHEEVSRHYGGQGYGSHKRPDASNTSFFLDALKEVKTENNSEAVKNAVIFMSRCQNLPSPHNDAEFARVAGADDYGGMIYSAVGKGETKAEATSETPKGGLRSYGSMTYAGLKSFLYAGIDKDDIRVKAALDWISRNYDLQSNPGVGQQGLFYYYHVFAKALSAYEQPTITTADGKAHDWQTDLVKVLAEKQQADGSWTNPADRWYEGDPNLVTSYSLLALSYCNMSK